MARSAVLNIIFGAETAQLERALGGVQKRLRRTAGEFKQLGDSMSRSVSLPIIGVGAAAIKAASDLETLETSFVSLAGGAGQAAKLVSELNDFTAKTPFQLEAVGTAARQLIAAGTPISEVKDQLQFLGDVAATSGSSIDEIAAIFSKVQAKGKVELESLNQLAERGIPIFTSLSEATGLPASELGAGAVSLEQFNDTLASFSEEGGFAAGAMERLSQTASGKFSTALDNLKLAGAALGEQLLPIVASLLDKVTSLAQSFANTSDSFKTGVLVIGGVVAAIGPLLVIIGSAINAYANLNLLLTGFKARQIASAAATAGDTAAKVTNTVATKAAEFAQKRLNLAVLANPYVLATAAVVGMGIALYNANKDVTVMQESVEDLQDNIYNIDTESAVKQIENLREEITETADEAASSQAWVETLKVQAGGIGFIVDLFTNYEKQLEDASAAAAELGKTQEKLLSDAEFAAEAEERLAAIAKKKADEAERQRLAAVVSIADLQDQAYSAGQELTRLQSKARIGINVDGLERIKALKDEIKDLEGQLDLLGAEPIDVGNFLKGLEGMEVGPQVSDLFSELEGTEVGPQVGDLLGQLEFMSFEEGVKRAEETYTTSVDAMAEKTQQLLQIGTNLGTAFGATFEQLASGSITGQEALKQVAGTALDTALAAAQAFAIEAALSSGKFSGPAAPIVIPALIGAFTGLVKGAFSSIPAFAQGGLVTGPTLAMVGDNPSGKEAIIPFERMGEFMKMSGGGGGQQNVVVTGRISGKDIVLSNERAGRDRSRIK